MAASPELSRALIADDVMTEGSLPLHVILEEEFERLHPGSAAQAVPPYFVADDLAHISALADALQDAVLRENADWRQRPPAPRGTPLQTVFAVVVHGQDELRKALHAHADGVGHRADNEANLRLLVVARLNALLERDLTDEPCFVKFVQLVRQHAGERWSDAPEARPVQNKLILDTALAPYVATTAERRHENILARIHGERHAALCLSGGGIRSASFAIGVLQGLARYGVLRRFDYLSTVSGGGYAGGWLSAWMARTDVETVCEQLRGVRTSKLDDEPPPLKHVREFSRYLNPQLGLMSADTWTLVASALRNILLMWLVMVPLMAAGLMIPRMFVSWPMTGSVEWREMGVDPGWLAIVLFAGATLLITAALVHVHRYLRPDPDDPDAAARPLASLGAFQARCLIPMVVGVALLTLVWQLYWSMYGATGLDAAALTSNRWAQNLINQAPEWSRDRYLPETMLAVYGAAMSGLAWAVGAKRWYNRWGEGLVTVLAGATAGALAALADAGLFGVKHWKHSAPFYATFAVPTFLALCVVGTQIFVGIACQRMSDAEREASARLNAWLLIVIVAWVSSFGLALYGPPVVRGMIDAPRVMTLLAALFATVGVLATMLRGRLPLPGRGDSGRGLDTIARILRASLAPIVAVASVVMISALNEELIRVACGFSSWCPIDPGRESSVLKGAPGMVFTIVEFAQPRMILLLGVLLIIIGLVLGRIINTNRFSLHALYSVRLVRTFLGASKAPGDRAPDAFTGFDATDDVAMRDLWPARSPHAASPATGGHPPLHVLNMALNVVASTRPATRERKAESFSVTALHAGSASLGYRRTSGGSLLDRGRLYGGDGGISLGTAMAISGAAASPNAGYHSSPAITFLMTLFNVRLGRWLGNPSTAGDHTYHRDEPKLGFKSILHEMFGRTTDKSPYVYLSDGSHFENLGLYEMVLRRCKLIVVSDAGCDPHATFDDLGGAIRKIRIDFGIPIDFDPDMAIYPRSEPEKAGDGVYWAVGRIRYSAVDGDVSVSPGMKPASTDGIILYLKPAFYGREPRDVFNYARKVDAFPHESTGNQFFGESQFESYRALGAHVIDELCMKEFDSALGVPLSGDQMDAWVDGRLAGR